jgi:hypothetical protein
MDAEDRKTYSEKYGIQIIGDDNNEGYPDIKAFLEQLRDAIAAVRSGKVRVSRRTRWLYAGIAIGGVWFSLPGLAVIFYAFLGLVSVGVTTWIVLPIARSASAEYLKSVGVLSAASVLAPYFLRLAVWNSSSDTVTFVVNWLAVAGPGPWPWMLLVGIGFAAANYFLCLLASRKELVAKGMRVLRDSLTTLRLKLKRQRT